MIISFCLHLYFTR